MPEPVTPPASKSTPGENPPPAIAGYEMCRRIGHGSYGEVWLAREESSGLFRAVKVVYRHTFEHDRPFERELSGIQKFEPVSLTHPSQVHILRVGRNLEAGYFYYVMELADSAGEESERVETWEDSRDVAASLAQPPPFSPARYRPRTLKHELQRRGRLPLNECLNVSLGLATALDHLHANDLIHRDIKPSNVIFVKGVPKLADIGLVTDVGATISHVGTEGFLPPEGPGTPQADIYSLGKVLYEISTGHDRLDFPELPTFVENSADKQNLLELNLIFLKACQNDPRKRYQSAREMFADLALLQSGKSLRRARLVEERLARLRLVAVGAAAAAILMAGTVYLLQQQRVRQAEAKRLREQEKKESAERSSNEKREQVANLYTGKGEDLEKAGDISGALAWFARAFLDESPASTNLLERRKRLISTFERCPKVPVLMAHHGPVTAANWSADGKRLITGSEDRTAQVWDAETGVPLGRSLKHDAAVRVAELSPDGSRGLTLSADGIATIWDFSSGAAARLRPGEPITAALLSPSGRQVLTISDQGAALWEAGSARMRYAIPHERPVLGACFSPDGRLAATAGADRAARVWDVESGEPVTPCLLHDAPVARVAFSPDGRRLVTTSGRQVRVWNARSGEPAFFALSHDADVTLAGFSPDNRFIVTTDVDRTVRLWDSTTGEPERHFFRTDGSVEDIAFSPDSQWLAVASGDRVRLCPLSSREGVAPPVVHNGAVFRVRFSPTGHLLLTASADQTARLTQTTLKGWSFLSGSNSVPPTLDQWAEFLSGRRLDVSQRLFPLKSDVLRELWRSLKVAHPSDFAPGEALSWHREEGEACEEAGAWFGARFHWEHVLALRPGDAGFAIHRERAERAWAEEITAAAKPSGLRPRIPARSAEAKPNLIDLGAFYNAILTQTWLPTNNAPFGNDLSALPRGVQRFGGVEFDVRGIVQLSGSSLENLGGRFPPRIEGIPVGRKCRRLHFLHGAAWSALAGTHVASYLIHYANGDQREIKVIFGHHLREWWFSQAQPLLTTGTAVAWEGSNAASRAFGQRLRLYQMAWSNPLPEIEVQRIDLRSTMEKPALFLIALTAE